MMNMMNFNLLINK